MYNLMLVIARIAFKQLQQFNILFGKGAVVRSHFQSQRENHQLDTTLNLFIL